MIKTGSSIFLILLILGGAVLFQKWASASSNVNGSFLKRLLITI
jgi:hypothetical protein